MPKFAMNQLCISIVDKYESEILFEASSTVVVCFEGMEMDVPVLVVVDPKNIKSSYLIDVAVANLISDCKNTIVKEKEIYKDKAILVFVTAKYVIDYSFNFKVQ